MQFTSQIYQNILATISTVVIIACATTIISTRDKVLLMEQREKIDNDFHDRVIEFMQDGRGISPADFMTYNKTDTENIIKLTEAIDKLVDKVNRHDVRISNNEKDIQQLQRRQ